MHSIYLVCITYFSYFFIFVDNELASVLVTQEVTNKMDQFIKELTMQHILAFVTGSSKSPAAGFQPSPQITFVHDPNKSLPAAQTCGNELLLFVSPCNMEIDKFCFNFLTSLMNGATFSTV